MRKGKIGDELDLNPSLIHLFTCSVIPADPNGMMNTACTCIYKMYIKEPQ